MSPSLRLAVAEAAETLAAAGVPSPRADALALAAHVLGVDRGEVDRRMILGGDLPQEFTDLVAERATRVPLQHLTGHAPFRRLDLEVGPGVFVPRPETEQVAQFAIEAAKGEDAPLVVDLCTGSGALALAVADEVAGADVVAVEVSELALAWARRNVERTGLPVTVVQADATSDLTAALGDLIGRVDVVVSNPPYIPTGMVPLDPEVRDHDPEVALFGGSADGLAIPLAVAGSAARLLRPAGTLVMEHAESQGSRLVAALRRTGAWSDVRDHQDLSGRPRTVVAVRGA